MTAKPVRKLALSVLFDTVTIEVICGDDYEAQVLYDDLVERMQAGEGITLSVESGSIANPAPPEEG
jgi:hypothetical protein